VEEFDNSPLVRTDYSNDEAWASLVRSATAASPDGFKAALRIVDESAYEGAEPESLATLDWHGSAVLFVADAHAQSHADQPILCVDLMEGGGSFRCIPSELWGVENNLRLANMDFRDFAENAAADGVFRGF
jgi:hypothetical protein